MATLNRNLENLLEENKNARFQIRRGTSNCILPGRKCHPISIRSGCVLVHAHENKPRIWYPDFYLPEFGTYIEYYGLKGKRNYDSGIKRKETTYAKMGLDVIPIYPWTFSEDWKGYIMKGIKQGVALRYHKLMSKPYWSRQGGVGYQRGSNRRY